MGSDADIRSLFSSSLDDFWSSIHGLIKVTLMNSMHFVGERLSLEVLIPSIFDFLLGPTLPF